MLLCRLLEVNPNGSVPVAKDLEADKWVVDSGVIADYLEDKYPEPHLGKSDQIPEAGTKLFPAFVQFLKASKEDEEAKKEAYIAQLAALSEYLKANGPFLEGSNISAADLALAPKLYHAVEALKHYKASPFDMYWPFKLDWGAACHLVGEPSVCDWGSIAPVRIGGLLLLLLVKLVRLEADVHISDARCIDGSTSLPSCAGPPVYFFFSFFFFS